MNRSPTYGSPAAFRRALTDNLRTLAQSSRWELPQLQRQMAYDRLLERLYIVDDGWIVKGATALLAREIGVRATRDIDLYRAARHDITEADLRIAAALELTDWFRFEVGAPRMGSDAASATRVPVAAYIGPTAWSEFHVDLVRTELRMTGEPEPVPALARVLMPDVEQHGYRAYPIVDHIADKVCATFESYGESARPSTRYKDLVDLVAIATEVSVSAEKQVKAFLSEADRRGLLLPERFAVPDTALWERGYMAEARRSLLATAQTLDEALEAVAPFVDPLLAGGATGAWNPRARQWS